MQLTFQKHTALIQAKQVFTCSLERNQHWSEGAFVMLLTSLRMWQKSWKGFHKMASTNVSNIFTVTGGSV